MHDTPMYNGVVERLNCVLLELTQAFLHSSTLPKILWGEAVKHAVWLKNRMYFGTLMKLVNITIYSPSFWDSGVLRCNAPFNFF